MKFPFKSKLERHLQSDDHKMFTESVQASIMLIDDDYEDFCIETHPKEVCSGMAGQPCEGAGPPD